MIQFDLFVVQKGRLKTHQLQMLRVPCLSQAVRFCWLASWVLRMMARSVLHHLQSIVFRYLFRFHETILSFGEFTALKAVYLGHKWMIRMIIYDQAHPCPEKNKNKKRPSLKLT